MWPYHPALLARAVPRYTSFPTAAEFGTEVSAADFAAALDAIEIVDRVSLYLHIPYCREICWYCGCNTGAANRPARLSRYLGALHDEIELVAGRIDRRTPIQRIALGGGSPNSIAPAQFDALIDHLRDAFSADAAVLSIEVDPRGFDRDWAYAIARNRIARASLGVQTFAPRLQAAIGRIQPAEQVEAVAAMLRDSGVTSLNFDLMYGLPGQSLDDLAHSLDAAIALRPERLAVFGYAHVPAMLPRQRRIDASDLPGAEARFRMAELASAVLIDAGYRPVGFDHFALPGDALAQAAATGTLRRNFQGYTEDPADKLIALGASAISCFPDLIVQNDKNAGRYAAAVEARAFPVERGIRRDAEDRRIGAAIMSLLCQGEAHLVGLARLGEVRAALRPFADAELIEWRDDHLLILPNAIAYARAIAATLDPYRATSRTSFSNAV